MYKTFSVRLLRSCTVACFSIILASGCNEARENLASAIKPKTVGDVVVAVDQSIAQSKFSQARIEGEQFLKNNEDSAGNLVWALAKACVQLGEYDAGIKYLQQALTINADYFQRAINEPLLEPIHTDIRFVSLISGVNPVTTNPPPRHGPNNSPKAAAQLPSSTAVTLNPGQVEARAGSVVVKLPD